MAAFITHNAVDTCKNLLDGGASLMISVREVAFVGFDSVTFSNCFRLALEVKSMLPRK